MIWDVPFLFSVWGGSSKYLSLSMFHELSIAPLQLLWGIDLQQAPSTTTPKKNNRNLTHFFFVLVLFLVRLPFYATSSFGFVFDFLLPFLPSLAIYFSPWTLFWFMTLLSQKVVVKYKIALVSPYQKRCCSSSPAPFQCLTEWWHTPVDGNKAVQW